MQQVDPPSGSVIYTIGVLESRIGGSTFWIRLRVMFSINPWFLSISPEKRSAVPGEAELTKLGERDEQRCGHERLREGIQKGASFLEYFKGST